MTLLSEGPPARAPAANGDTRDESATAVHIEGPIVREASVVLTSRPVLAVAVLIALIGLTGIVPALGILNPLGPAFLRSERADAPPHVVADTVGEAEVDVATEARNDLAQPETVRMPAATGPIAADDDEATDLPHADADKPPLSIVDGARSLDRFFAALGRTARKAPQATTRILFYGDSMVASDFGTGTLRRKLQAEFGDGGHGFVLVANAWPQYFHNDVFRVASKGWKVSRVVGPYQKDGLYGLGGVSFLAPPGVHSVVGTAKDGHFGRSVSKFVLSYLEEPRGGTVEISVDEGPRSILDTSGAAPKPAFHEIRLPDGPHELAMKVTRGSARLFGFVLERDAPGVVLDAIGLVGARIRFLDKLDDTHWAQMLRWRNPNLVVYQFGANESGDGFAYPMSEYHVTMKEVLGKVRAAVPDAGCLVVGAMDRARKEGTRLVTVPIIPHIVEEQRKVAQEAGCAFFDTFQAMGGKGSMAKWVRRGYGAGDFTHPTSWGAEVLGNWIYQALIERWEEYRVRKASD